MTLLIFSPSVGKASNPKIVTASSDTYVAATAPSTAFGRENYLEVADSQAGLSLAFLMFNLSGLSYVFNASSEIKLQLRVFNVTSPHVIGVYWCLNNTWNEDNLTFEDISHFIKSDLPENVASVAVGHSWYEWTVTYFAWNATQQRHFDMLTLVLQVEQSREENDFVLFYSKDQDLLEYRPQLVFSYKSSSPDITPYIIFASVVLAGIILVAYWFLRKRKREKYYGKSRFQHKSVRSAK
jgi:uncharacterized membrane protein